MWQKMPSSRIAAIVSQSYEPRDRLAPHGGARRLQQISGDASTAVVVHGCSEYSRRLCRDGPAGRLKTPATLAYSWFAVRQPRRVRAAPTFVLEEREALARVAGDPRRVAVLDAVLEQPVAPLRQLGQRQPLASVDARSPRGTPRAARRAAGRRCAGTPRRRRGRSPRCARRVLLAHLLGHGQLQRRLHAHAVDEVQVRLVLRAEQLLELLLGRLQRQPLVEEQRLGFVLRDEVARPRRSRRSASSSQSNASPPTGSGTSRPPTCSAGSGQLRTAVQQREEPVLLAAVDRVAQLGDDLPGPPTRTSAPAPACVWVMAQVDPGDASGAVTLLVLLAAAARARVVAAGLRAVGSGRRRRRARRRGRRRLIPPPPRAAAAAPSS